MDQVQELSDALPPPDLPVVHVEILQDSCRYCTLLQFVFINFNLLYSDVYYKYVQSVTEPLVMHF